MNSPNEHPEFIRAAMLVDDAVNRMAEEGGDIHGFAFSLLMQSTALYSIVHGNAGKDGSCYVLRKIADLHEKQGATDG